MSTETLPSDVEYKSAEHAYTGEVDEKGVFEAIIAVTVLEDAVNDVIEPGAFTKSLAERTPKGINGHDWKTPIAKTLEIKELRPGDPLLRKVAPELAAAGGGGLYVKARYLLGTQAGREAYEVHREFGDDTAWSVGYNVPPGGAKSRGGTRYIKEMAVHEYSQVLWGAAPYAKSISVKDATAIAELEIKPWHVRRDDDAYVVVNSDTGEEVDGGRHDTREKAERHRRALYANYDEKRHVSSEERDKLADQGHALPDGSFPIANVGDLKNAIQAYGRAKNKARAKRHIIKRAKALGQTDLLPDKWDAGTKDLTTASAPVASNRGFGEVERVGENPHVFDDDGAGLCTLCGEPADAEVHVDAKSLVTAYLDPEVKKSARAAAGADRDRGNAEVLRRYWTRGRGAQKIRWGTEGDWRRCVAHLTKYLGPRARGYCSLRHKESTGLWTGDRAHREGVNSVKALEAEESRVIVPDGLTREEYLELVAQETARELDGDWADMPIPEDEETEAVGAKVLERLEDAGWLFDAHGAEMVRASVKALLSTLLYDAEITTDDGADGMERKDEHARVRRIPGLEDVLDATGLALIETKALWREAQHPRDARGRFVETGSFSGDVSARRAARDWLSSRSDAPFDPAQLDEAVGSGALSERERDSILRAVPAGDATFGAVLENLPTYGADDDDGEDTGSAARGWGDDVVARTAEELREAIEGEEWSRAEKDEALAMVDAGDTAELEGYFGLGGLAEADARDSEAGDSWSRTVRATEGVDDTLTVGEWRSRLADDDPQGLLELDPESEDEEATRLDETLGYFGLNEGHTVGALRKAAREELEYSVGDDDDEPTEAERELLEDLKERLSSADSDGFDANTYAQLVSDFERLDRIGQADEEAYGRMERVRTAAAKAGYTEGTLDADELETLAEYATRWNYHDLATALRSDKPIKAGDLRGFVQLLETNAADPTPALSRDSDRIRALYERFLATREPRNETERRALDALRGTKSLEAELLELENLRLAAE